MYVCETTFLECVCVNEHEDWGRREGIQIKPITQYLAITKSFFFLIFQGEK